MLINISSTSAKSRGNVIKCDEIIQAVASVLVSQCVHTGPAIWWLFKWASFHDVSC